VQIRDESINALYPANILPQGKANSEHNSITQTIIRTSPLEFHRKICLSSEHDTSSLCPSNPTAVATSVSTAIISVTRSNNRSSNHQQKTPKRTLLEQIDFQLHSCSCSQANHSK
jgi:hypothetical protein